VFKTRFDLYPFEFVFRQPVMDDIVDVDETWNASWGSRERIIMNERNEAWIVRDYIDLRFDDITRF
jgi:hypothetical protein